MHYLGIVAKKSSKYKSGYEVANHARYADTLVKVDLHNGGETYHPLDLPKEQKDLPGQKLVDYINRNHPDLNILVTGDRTLKDERLKKRGITNDSYKSRSDIKEVIGKYKNIAP